MAQHNAADEVGHKEHRAEDVAAFAALIIEVVGAGLRGVHLSDLQQVGVGLGLEVEPVDAALGGGGVVRGGVAGLVP